MNVFRLSLIIMFGVNTYGAESGGDAAYKQCFSIMRRLRIAGDRLFSNGFQIEPVSDDELVGYINNQANPINVACDGISFLNQVIYRCLDLGRSDGVLFYLLHRPDLDVDFKVCGNDTALDRVIQNLKDLSGFEDIPAFKNVLGIQRALRMIKDLQKRGAKLENMSIARQNVLLSYGQGLSLQQSYCKMLTCADMKFFLLDEVSFPNRYFEGLIFKRPINNQDRLKLKCLYFLRCIVGDLRRRSNISDAIIKKEGLINDLFDYPLALMLATRKIYKDKQTGVTEIVQNPAFSVQERYLQLQEFMPQSTIMQFLRLIVLSDVSSKLIDIDVQKEEQRMCAELKKPESNKEALHEQLQNLRNHKLRLWVLSAYHDFHKLQSVDTGI